jgi:hypothetical protein
MTLTRQTHQVTLPDMRCHSLSQPVIARTPEVKFAEELTVTACQARCGHSDVHYWSLFSAGMLHAAWNSAESNAFFSAVTLALLFPVDCTALCCVACSLHSPLPPQCHRQDDQVLLLIPMAGSAPHHLAVRRIFHPSIRPASFCLCFLLHSRLISFVALAGRFTTGFSCFPLVVLSYTSRVYLLAHCRTSVRAARPSSGRTATRPWYAGVHVLSCRTCMCIFVCIMEICMLLCMYVCMLDHMRGCICVIICMLMCI